MWTRVYSGPCLTLFYMHLAVVFMAWPFISELHLD